MDVQQEEVISEEDLEQLLDRSDLIRKMERKKTKVIKQEVDSQEEEQLKEVSGVFKVVNDDMGGSTKVEKCEHWSFFCVRYNYLLV